MPNDKTFLITGLSSLVGVELAKTLLQDENTHIIGFSRSTDYVKEFSPSEQSRIQAISVDLSNMDELSTILENLLLNNLYPITDFIHLAGVFPYTKIKAIQYTKALQEFNINFFSATIIISTLLQRRYKQNLSNIVFLSSVSVLKGSPGFSIYSSSKASLHSFMKSFAVELKGKIKINTVVAGMFQSKSNKDILDNSLISNQGYLLGIGQTSDIVNAINYFITNKSKWIIGQTLVVDGGYTV